MNKHILMVTALCALLCASCGPRNTAPATEFAVADPNATPDVTVTGSGRQQVAQDAVYSATVQAKAVNNIAPLASGRIQKLNVEVGDFVSAGQILAEMDRVQLDQAELRLRNDETELARVKQLSAEGGVSQ